MEPERRKWRLGVGADHAGVHLKDPLRDALRDHPAVESVRDFGVTDERNEVAYACVALPVAEAIARGEIDRAILVCGTGIGMAIAANKVAGIRATVAYDLYSVERSVLSNNCQVLALGANVIAFHLAERIVDAWLSCVFDQDSASAAKVAVISAYEQEHTCGGKTAGPRDTADEAVQRVRTHSRP